MMSFPVRLNRREPLREMAMPQCVKWGLTTLAISSGGMEAFRASKASLRDLMITWSRTSTLSKLDSGPLNRFLRSNYTPFFVR